MGVWSKNRLHFGTISGKNSTSSQNVSPGILGSNKGGRIYIEEGSHLKKSVKKGQFLSNLFLARKKDGGTDL